MTLNIKFMNAKRRRVYTAKPNCCVPLQQRVVVLEPLLVLKLGSLSMAFSKPEIMILNLPAENSCRSYFIDSVDLCLNNIKYIYAEIIYEHHSFSLCADRIPVCCFVFQCRYFIHVYIQT